MKHLITILAAVLCAVCLSGCEKPTQNQIDAEMASQITEFNHKGHRYLRYVSGAANDAVGGITHDPDCPCYKEGGEE